MWLPTRKILVHLYCVWSNREVRERKVRNLGRKEFNAVKEIPLLITRWPDPGRHIHRSKRGEKKTGNDLTMPKFGQLFAIFQPRRNGFSPRTTHV